MQFSWRNAHSYHVSSATKTVRYGVTVFVAIFLTSLWYFFVHMRLQTAIAVSQTALQQSTALEQTMCAMQSALQEKTAQQTVLQEELNALLHATSVFGAQDNLFFVLGLLEQHSLQLLQYEPQAAVDKGWYIKQKVKTSFSGAYSNVHSFFTALNAVQRAVTCPTLSVQRLHDGVVRVQTELCFFQYKKDVQ